MSPDITKCSPGGRITLDRPTGLSGGLLVAKRLGSCCYSHQGGFAILQIADVCAAAAHKLVSAHILTLHQSMEISLCAKDHLWEEWEGHKYFPCTMKEFFSQECPHSPHPPILNLPKQVEHPFKHKAGHILICSLNNVYL